MWRKLQRDTRHAWVGGVCSGAARFIGLDNFPARVLLRILFVTMVPMFWWVYLLLWIVLPAQKLYEAEEAPATAWPTPKPKRPKAVYRPKTRIEVKRMEAEDVIEMTRDRVSERVFARVEAIDAAVRTLNPHFTWWRLLTRPDIRTIRHAALEYFPQALQHYMQLPRDYAENHKLASGLTPEASLLEDLRVLETTLSGMLESLYNNEKVRVPDELKRLSEHMGASDSPGEDIGRTFETLLNRIRGKVSDDILERVESIRATTLSVLPQITEMGAGMTQEAYNLRQTALEYLPDALDKYLSLPEGFAETHVLSNGKTAKETLLEQLDLLDATVKDIVGDAYQEDAEALLVHGRFLKDKFAGQKFTLPEADSAVKFPDLGTARAKDKNKEKVRI